MELDIARELLVNGQDAGLALDLRSSFRQENLDVDLLILNTLNLLGALQERNHEDVTSCRSLAQEVGSVRVPANCEGILPASKNGITGLELKQRLSVVASESRGGHVSDGVDKVSIHASNLEWDTELLESVGDGVVVLRLRPLHSVEEGGEVCTPVVQLVSLLKGNVSTPVADFNIAVEGRDVGDGLRKLESNLRWGHSTGGLLVKGAVDKL